MSTTIRLPTTPVPAPSDPADAMAARVEALCGLLVLRDAGEAAAGRVRALAPHVDRVVVVDDGSEDGSADRAEAAGARVLRLPSPRGRGAALRAGIRLARELGYVGALAPGLDDLADDDAARLVAAHVRAPEALLVGVGPGQALAGKEWEEARALAEGRASEPYPAWRPTRSPGWAGAVEDALLALAETRFGTPWGGPRLLPLQPVLRRPLREDGEGIDVELLGLCVHAGVPTIEVELGSAPRQSPLTCRKAALRLILRFRALALRRRAREGLGMGGGYAPPTTSPLGLLLGLGLFALAGCPRPVAVAPPEAACPGGLAANAWPGEGDAEAARDGLLAQRAATATVRVEEEVELVDRALGRRSLRGLLAMDGRDRLRVRLLAALGVVVADYVEADGRWQLTIPLAGIRRAGVDGEPPLRPDELEEAGLGLDPPRVADLLRSLGGGAQVRWRPGACAVLEELDGDDVVRRLAFVQDADAGWLVAEEELVRDGEVVARAVLQDYRSVGAGHWPHRAELLDPQRGAAVTLLARDVRTDGVTDALFAMTAP